MVYGNKREREREKGSGYTRKRFHLSGVRWEISLKFMNRARLVRLSLSLSRWWSLSFARYEETGPQKQTSSPRHSKAVSKAEEGKKRVR